MNVEIAATIVWSVLIMLVLVCVPFLLFWLIDFLGTKNFLFTKPIEGRFLYVMRGGRLKRIIYSIKGWRLDETTGKMVQGERQKGLIETMFGVQWLGIPFIDSILVFELSWDELGKKKDETGYSVIPHDKETVDGLYFQSTYVLQLKEAETAGQIPLNVRIILSVRRSFPERAAFKLGSPELGLNTVSGLALNQARKIIRTLSVDKILGLGENVSQEDTVDMIVQEIYKLNTYANLSTVRMDVAEGETEGALSNLTGYEVLSVSIESVEPILSAEELGVLRSIPLAEKKGEAEVILARKKKEAEILLGQGRAGALQAEVDVMNNNQNARDVAMMNRVEKSKLLTLNGTGINILAQPSDSEKEEKTEE